MRFMRLGWAELIAVGASIVLLASLFLPWFITDSGNRNSKIAGKTGALTAFDVFPTFVWILLAACVAPLILSYIVMRGHKLTWDRGEVTAIVGMTVLVLVLYNGIIGGNPDESQEAHIGPGYYAALVAAVGMFIGGVLRLGEGGTTNKPPGV